MVDDEPAGCVRIRCFANFAKIERLAVRREFRGRQLALRLAEAAIDLCRMKGYGKIGGHAAHHMVPFWEQFGFRVVGNGDPFVFSDFEYVAMCMDFEPHPNAVMFESDPHVVLRPEGAWHRQGILERSTARPVTTPSIVRGAA
jgi:GNAT superfamily N-acetyltransferase